MFILDYLFYTKQIQLYFKQNYVLHEVDILSGDRVNYDNTTLLSLNVSLYIVNLPKFSFSYEFEILFKIVYTINLLALIWVNELCHHQIEIYQPFYYYLK